MKNTQLAQNVKALRTRKGYSQEELAEKTGLSLRTIQRIENGETEPRGDSLQKLSAALDVLPEDIADWALQENNGFLASLNLSALSFLLSPLLGILVPLIIWISKKDRVRNVNKVAKSLLNFEITMVLLYAVAFLYAVVGMVRNLNGIAASTADESMVASGMSSVMGNMLVSFVVLFLYHIVMIIVNAVRAYKGKSVKYFPQIRFMRP